MTGPDAGAGSMVTHASVDLALPALFVTCRRHHRIRQATAKAFSLCAGAIAACHSQTSLTSVGSPVNPADIALSC